MNWHHPDLYLFLSLLAGSAALLAIIYECIERFGRRKSEQGDGPVYLEKTNPLDDLRSQAAGKRDAEQFSQLCESTKDLPAKEQASRVREHFGIFGGVRPHLATRVTGRCT